MVNEVEKWLLKWKLSGAEIDINSEHTLINKISKVSGTLYIPEGITVLKDVQGNNIQRVYLPDSLEYIVSSCFRMCERLEYVRLPKGFQSLESGLFSGCKSLSVIENCEDVHVIGQNCFMECSSLKSIDNFKSITEINSFSFYNCGLESVSIDLRTITSNSFSHCDQLKDVKIIGTGDEVVNQIFGVNCLSPDCRFILPEWMKDDYKRNNILGYDYNGEPFINIEYY